MIERDVTVTVTPEDIALYDRARAINLPTLVVSMYGDRIKMLLAEEREACAKVCEERIEYWQRDDNRRDEDENCAAAIRARGQA